MSEGRLEDRAVGSAGCLAGLAEDLELIFDRVVAFALEEVARVGVASDEGQRPARPAAGDKDRDPSGRVGTRCWRLVERPADRDEPLLQVGETIRPTSGSYSEPRA
jgi:hypothetical protein